MNFNVKHSLSWNTAQPLQLSVDLKYTQKAVTDSQPEKMELNSTNDYHNSSISPNTLIVRTPIIIC